MCVFPFLAAKNRLARHTPRGYTVSICAVPSQVRKGHNVCPPATSEKLQQGATYQACWCFSHNSQGWLWVRGLVKGWEKFWHSVHRTGGVSLCSKRLCSFHCFPLLNFICFSHFTAKTSCAASVEVRHSGNSGKQEGDFLLLPFILRQGQSPAAILAYLLFTSDFMKLSPGFEGKGNH